MSDASEQDKAIALAVLAGWRLEPRGNLSGYPDRYVVTRPDGSVVGFRSTRYTAALMALSYIQDLVR